MSWIGLRVVGLVVLAGWLPHACAPDAIEGIGDAARGKPVKVEQADVVDFLFWPAEGWKRVELELAVERGSR